MRIDQWLRRQDGVISLAQAAAAGLGARGVRHRVAAGRWERVHPRVYRAWAWHVSADRYQGDRRRQNTVVLDGWTVLRFTWADLTARPDEVLVEIKSALAVAHPPT